MKKLFTKVLFLCATSLLSNNLLAQETICFKNGVEKPSIIESVGLNGDICNGSLTLNDMKTNGWEILDIKIVPNQGKFDYTYYFYKNEKVSSVENKTSLKTEEKPSSNNFSVKPIGVKVDNVDGNKSIINVGNLIVGETGVVVHIFDNDKRLIVSNAKVISSNSENSVVEFFAFDDLKQKAIPTSNRTPQKGDVLILNYMYNSSLLIAPSVESFQAVRENFKLNNFMHSDIFAAKLKVDNNPYPTKEDIQKFAIEQNLGTIFFVLDNKIYIVDTKTFKVLESYSFALEIKNKQMPFYTRVEEIEESLFSFSYFSWKKSATYDQYYKRILGLDK